LGEKRRGKERKGTEERTNESLEAYWVNKIGVFVGGKRVGFLSDQNQPKAVDKYRRDHRVGTDFEEAELRGRGLWRKVRQ
jgi:hypothetical protein